MEGLVMDAAFVAMRNDKGVKPRVCMPLGA
jgi:hypothetical protein